MRPMLSYRPASPTDRAALGVVAFRTGFFGEPADVYFPQPDLFAALWMDPFLTHAGCCCFVCEEEREVVGYVVGACDVGEYRKQLVAAVLRAAWGVLRGRYPGWRGCVPFLLRGLVSPSRQAPWRDFPAQLHLNLLPAARGQGAGRALLERYLGCLEAAGVRGVQLSTTLENVAAVALYRSTGFEVWRARRRKLWRPWIGHSAVHVVMIKSMPDRRRRSDA